MNPRARMMLPGMHQQRAQLPPGAAPPDSTGQMRPGMPVTSQNSPLLAQHLSGRPGGPGGPGGPGAPGGPGQPNPNMAGQSPQQGQPGQPGQPPQAGQPDQPGQPSQPGQANRPVQPAQPGQPQPTQQQPQQPPDSEQQSGEGFDGGNDELGDLGMGDMEGNELSIIFIWCHLVAKCGTKNLILLIFSMLHNQKFSYIFR